MTRTGCTYTLPGALLFDGDSAVLRTGIDQLLAAPISVMAKHPGSHAELKGHAASTPGATRKWLDWLSRERAKRVAAAFVAAGIDPALLTTKGVGDREPLGEDINAKTGKQIPEAAARERRVDITIQEAGPCSR